MNISNITGTGKNGRVLKEDVHRYAAARDGESEPPQQPTLSRPAPGVEEAQNEESIKLSPVQSQMFKTMSRSLTIPHFLYADEIDISALSSLRNHLKTSKHEPQKLSYLPS